jgi:hypothetical protein
MMAHWRKTSPEKRVNFPAFTCLSGLFAARGGIGRKTKPPQRGRPPPPRGRRGYLGRTAGSRVEAALKLQIAQNGKNRPKKQADEYE